VGGHEANRPYSKLKRIDATGGPRHYTAEPADAGIELESATLGEDVRNQWR
jgi:hypothetical protein